VKRSESLVAKLFAEAERYLSFSSKDTFIEKVLDAVLTEKWPESFDFLMVPLLEEIKSFDTRSIKVVVFGGGTGLSSITGGNSKSPQWALNPFVGLKENFKKMKLVVCTTDDGGSTGKIIQKLPVIALGDLRKACLSMLTLESLRDAYGLDDGQALKLAGALQKIINFRFKQEEDRHYLVSPLSLLSDDWKTYMPVSLQAELENLGKFIQQHPLLGQIGLQDHCQGNLLLLAWIYRRMAARGEKADGIPKPEAILDGIHDFGQMLGVPRGTIYPATTTQGELSFLYANGVMVSGQNKAAVSQRHVPIERLVAKYRTTPFIAPELRDAIREADIMILAPGSLYSSIIPIFQIEGLCRAVRSNTDAMKLLVANFWVQKGESDRSTTHGRENFYVSDLVEAYFNNIPEGIKGIFDRVIVSDLKQIPGNILQRYAIEGKTPIYLDKNRVRDAGFEAIEGAIFSRQKLESDFLIQHDPDKFSLAIRALLYFKKYLTMPFYVPAATKHVSLLKGKHDSVPFISQQLKEALTHLESLDIPDKEVRDFLPRLLWNNRDMTLAHLHYFKGIRVIEPEHWGRSTEWDKILGYFDTGDRYIKIRKDLFKLGEGRLEEDLLIGIGESLLGVCFHKKTIRPLMEGDEIVGKVFEIELAPPDSRNTYLNHLELRQYLALSGMEESTAQEGIFRKAVNRNEAFTPCGLLFGLCYAWYLNNRYGGELEFEMSLVKQEITDLMPKQRNDFQRRRELIRFFREVVFKQKLTWSF